MIGRLAELGVLAMFAASIVPAQGNAASSRPTPRFRDYPVNEKFQGPSAEPVFATPEQRRYRSRIHSGILNGTGVWNGSWKHPATASEPNFAGHYYVIRWGCGSNCLMMAIVDGQTGRIYNPPLSGAGTELYVPMDMLGDGEIDFEPNSSLMILRNACAEARKECGVYYFNWENNNFSLVKRILVDLMKAEEAKEK
jgi:hypothetical protein